MYILITEDKVFVKSSLKKLVDSSKMQVKQEDFDRFGNAYIAKNTDKSIRELFMDAFILEKSILRKLYKQEFGLVELILLFNVLLSLFILMKK
ncbi:MAG: hypothetical protein MI748_20160 [Opitutales bacterium]|nr:hypothetical protein [Opitutales bacterium]